MINILSLPLVLQCGKVHCVWMIIEEINVLFESKERLPETENLQTAHIRFVRSKDVVTE